MRGRTRFERTSGSAKSSPAPARTWFDRGDEAARRHIPGTGLGLSIVRTIVVAHGGEVTVDSTPGEGSAFHVMLPRGG